MKNEGRTVAFLELVFRLEVLMALHRANPAILRTDDGDRLALHQNFRGVDIDIRRLGAIGTARVNLGEHGLHIADFAGDALPLQGLVANQRGQLLLLGDQLLAFGL